MLPYLTLTPIPFILTGNRTRVSCKVLLHFSWIRFIKIKSFKISETKLLLAPSRQIVVKTAWKKKSRIHLRVCNCSLLISFWRWIDSVAWCRKGRIPEQRWKRSVSDVVIDWLQERFSYTVVSKLTAAQSYLTQHLKSFKLFWGGVLLVFKRYVHIVRWRHRQWWRCSFDIILNKFCSHSAGISSCERTHWLSVNLFIELKYMLIWWQYLWSCERASRPKTRDWPTNKTFT